MAVLLKCWWEQPRTTAGMLDVKRMTFPQFWCVHPNLYVPS